MKERLSLIGGTLELASDVENRTKVKITIPHHRTRAKEETG